MLRSLFRRIRAFAVKTRTVDDTFEMQWKDARRSGGALELSLLAFSWLVSRLMRSNTLIMKSVLGLENLLDAPRVHDALFEKYRPHAVVLTSLGTFDNDHYVMREAKRQGQRECLSGHDGAHLVPVRPHGRYLSMHGQA